jgi:hypothetical protein
VSEGDNVPEEPEWRGEQAGKTLDAFPLVIDPKLPRLPLHELPWERFEDLVLEIVEEVEKPVQIQPYGLRGQKQQGIDVIAKTASGGWHVFQTRQVKNFRLTHLRDIVDAFLTDPRPFEARRLVIATSCDRVSAQVQKAIFGYARAHPAIEFDQIWDAGELNRKLRRLPRIVARYFGEAAARRFCDEDSLLTVTVPPGRLVREARRPSDCDVDEDADPDRLGIQASGSRLTRRIPVRQTNPRRLGVHAAISVVGVPDEIPPEYVPRDADDGEFGVRAKVATASQRGGFVLLVGGSSVGKTRCAFEAVSALLPDWGLVCPSGPGDVAALAASPAPRTVIWLDELQNYLDGEAGLDGDVMRALLNARYPTVIVATIRPDWYNVYAALPSASDADRYAREREVLGLAAEVRIRGEFSPAERDRARTAAKRDRRLMIALETTGYGLTQTLAAAPQLVARWRDAPAVDSYAWAVLAAALDAARLGVRTPLRAGFLRAAAPGYLSSRQLAEAPWDWFEQALDYTTVILHGAVSALSPAGAGMGKIAGYTVADYLLQHVGVERLYERVPASTWEALLTHVTDPADAARLAGKAHDMLLYGYAIALIRTAADAGNAEAARRLASFLRQRGDLDEAIRVLQGLADTGDHRAARELAILASKRGDLDPLKALAHTDSMAAYDLVDAAKLLACHGNQDAMHWLISGADAGHYLSARGLAELLAASDDLDQLWVRANDGDWVAAVQLAQSLAERSAVDEALQVLRVAANGADDNATRRPAVAPGPAQRPARLGSANQAPHPTWDTLGKHVVAHALAELLGEHGDLEELGSLADAGDVHAAFQLAVLKAKSGDLEELQFRADAGDQDAALELATITCEHQDLKERTARTEVGDSQAGGAVVELLAEHGDVEELKVLAAAGDWYAAGTLMELLTERGDLDALLALATAGHAGVDGYLCELLTKQGRVDETQRLRRYGLNPDGKTIAST